MAEKTPALDEAVSHQCDLAESEAGYYALSPKNVPA